MAAKNYQKIIDIIKIFSRKNVLLDIIIGGTIPLIIYVNTSSHNSTDNEIVDFMSMFASLLGFTLPLIMMIIERASKLDNPASAIAVFTRTKICTLLAESLTSLLLLIFNKSMQLYGALSIMFIATSAYSYIQTIILFINRNIMSTDSKTIRTQLFLLSNNKCTAKIAKELIEQCFQNLADKACECIQNRDAINAKILLNELGALFKEYLIQSQINVEYTESRKFESIFSPNYRPELYEKYNSLIRRLISCCRNEEPESIESVNSFASSLLITCITAEQIEPLKAISESFASSSYRCMKYSNFDAAATKINEKIYILDHISEKKKAFVSRATIVLSDLFVRMIYSEYILAEKHESLISTIRYLKELSGKLEKNAKNILNDNIFAITSYIFAKNNDNKSLDDSLLVDYFEDFNANDITNIYTRLVNPDKRKKEYYSDWDMIVHSINGEKGNVFFSMEDENFTKYYAYVLWYMRIDPKDMKWNKDLAINARDIAQELKKNYNDNDLSEWFLDNADKV